MNREVDIMSKRYYACVYGGASKLLDDVYIKEVERLGEKIAENGFNLVYGAGASGCMGAVARGVKKSGGYILGVSPHFIREFEPMFDCDNSVLVDTMSERKMIMEKHADIFIITPGGVGTMDEFFQVLTLRHLKQMDTPIVILNINGFYDSLLKLMDSLIELKVVSKEVTEYYDVITSVDDAVLAERFNEIKKG